MKTIIRLLMFTLCLTCLPLQAQQQQEERRTTSKTVYPTFRDATVHFSFMRKGKAKANIFLKDASLLFLKDSVVMKADLSEVISVDFDSARYMRVDPTCMGRVVAEKGPVALVCVTTIDLKTYTDEDRKGDNLPYFSLEDFNIFLVIDGDYREDAVGWPLQDKYYFMVRGDAIPANERTVKKHIRADKKEDFKVKMADRFWSWRDAHSLTELIDYF